MGARWWLRWEVRGRDREREVKVVRVREKESDDWCNG